MMKLDDKIRDQNYNMIITGKQEKYQFYHLEKKYHLTGEEILPSNQRKIIEKAKFAYSP